MGLSKYFQNCDWYDEKFNEAAKGFFFVVNMCIEKLNFNKPKYFVHVECNEWNK